MELIGPIGVNNLDVNRDINFYSLLFEKIFMARKRIVKNEGLCVFNNRKFVVDIVISTSK